MERRGDAERFTAEAQNAEGFTAEGAEGFTAEDAEDARAWRGLGGEGGAGGELEAAEAGLASGVVGPDHVFQRHGVLGVDQHGQFGAELAATAVSLRWTSARPVARTSLSRHSGRTSRQYTWITIRSRS